ncbi:hypothetical protein [Pseudomonas aeruginosa]|uniref:hypothetical protein n=1 Tax=Pseudomonas aeruginosa TaxID=287 RepID=UPI000F817946|nr:hypothetical protein [Pseudomonas aeruginosa]RTX31103.1 hypothetical protein DZA21_21575 [Pseudomonas aeruginosa]
MEQAMRDEFEAAYPLPEGMERNGESYTGGEMWWLWEERWQVWQRSRAALRVELPEVGSAPDGAKYDLGFGDPKFAHDYREHQVSAAMRQLCREALQQAGIEVKHD